MTVQVSINCQLYGRFGANVNRQRVWHKSKPELQIFADTLSIGGRYDAARLPIFTIYGYVAFGIVPVQHGKTSRCTGNSIQTIRGRSRRTR
jgi:hypothetical protein